MLAALAVVAAMIPAAMASHTVGLPDETGLGAGNVVDEPNHARDNNGFPHTGFKPQSPELILEGVYTYGTPYPYYQDVNVILNTATHGDDYESHEDYMFPGFGMWTAWWGWWTDLGSGGMLNEAGVGSGTPDGSIQDGHDDHATNGATQWTGPWDEFIWRGKNPWASQHGYQSHADSMYLFIHPGTHKNVFSEGDPYLALINMVTDGDHAQVPDIQVEDRTDQGASCWAGDPHADYRCNGAGYGWLSEFGFGHFNYDASLLITTEAVFSVNPESTGAATYDPHSGVAVDADTYSAVNPAVESIYRTAVWDPDDKVESPLDGVAGEEGIKQTAKVFYNYNAKNSADVLVETEEDVREPTNPAVGVADDASGARPFEHEPNQIADDYPAASCSADPCATYGGLDTYYQPTQDWSGYAADEEAFLDMQPVRADVPQFQLQSRDTAGEHNDFVPTLADPLDQSRQSFAPGFLFLEGWFGTWHDENGDTFVGNLDEFGRYANSGDPYMSGNVDDPNDYGDTPKAALSDPAKEYGEWRGLGGSGDAEITAVIEPVGGSWGTAGVYILRDCTTNSQYNAWDDVVTDTLGLSDDCEGGNYRTSGPITFSFNPGTDAAEGRWWSDENLLLPLGSLEVDVRITTTATVLDAAKRTSRVSGDDLTGETVTDVDVLYSQL